MLRNIKSMTSHTIFLVLSVANSSMANEFLGSQYLNDVQYKLELAAESDAMSLGMTLSDFKRFHAPARYKTASETLQDFETGKVSSACTIADQYIKKLGPFSYVYPDVDKAMEWALLADEKMELCGSLVMLKIYEEKRCLEWLLVTRQVEKTL